MATASVKVSETAHAGRFAVARAIATVLNASITEEWVDNSEAAWAAMEGVERIAKALGYKFEVVNDRCMIVDTRS